MKLYIANLSSIFSKLLLAYQPEATHDYKGEGMSVRELAEILKRLPAAGPNESGLNVEQMVRLPLHLSLSMKRTLLT